MSLKNWLGSLIFPKESKFNTAFADAVAIATLEIQEMSYPIKEFANLWIVAAPAKYFIEVFLENAKWNDKFIKIFTDSQMINADKCFIISQAYILSFIINDQCDRTAILNEIRTKLTIGCELISLLDEFVAIRNNAVDPEFLFMPYINKILSTQYHDMAEVGNSRDLREYFDHMTALGFSTYTIEFLAICKRKAQ